MYATLVCGQLSLANAAFMGMGAYTAALLTLRLDAPFALALLAGGALAALVAVPLGLPVLRLRGVFLAIATIGFGEVLRVVLINATDLTGGASGLARIPVKTEGWQVALALALLGYGFWRLRGSRLGYAFEAIRQDESAARTMGIDIARHKLAAFVASAFIAGVAGGFFAHVSNAIAPRDFGFTRAVDILVYAIVGGSTVFAGPMLGAALLTALPEVLRQLKTIGIEPGAATVFVNGLVLLLVILFLPNGLTGRRRARRSPPAAPTPREVADEPVAAR
ncbi:MAG: branched-chain amino acid ABC transporter permease [Chloroflexi bacterium]|nr:branched-chain amino acid ABC transporter permease [Chloroflexota bacterium]